MADERLPYDLRNEPELLVGALRYLRASIRRKLGGLDDADLVRSPVPSGTSLRGLAEHLIGTEAIWIVYLFEASDEAIPSPERWASDRTLAEVLDEWNRYAERTDAIGLSTPLDTESGRPTEAGPVTLRWILVHLVEELARHAGHADILREQIDGTTGR